MFSEHFNSFLNTVDTSNQFSDTLVEQALSCLSTLPPLHRLHILLSRLTTLQIEKLITLSHQISLQRFGHSIQLFAPLYVSNSCYNICRYCFFSRDNPSARITLTPDECHKECLYLANKGFQHILLLSGEHRKDVPPSFFVDLIQREKGLFSYFSLETYALTRPEYESLYQAGLGGIVFYQETYHPDIYQKLHTAGPKKHFNGRLDTPDLVAQSGIRNIGLGALLGLAPPLKELLCLGHHINYLMTSYPHLQISISFPRLKRTPLSDIQIHSISDLQLMQIICAFRLVFPTVHIVLSTRETPSLRDKMIPIGVTHMSAESATNPGGYSVKKDSLKQFSTDDHRSVEQIYQSITYKGYQPVWKDWEIWTT